MTESSHDIKPYDPTHLDAIYNLITASADYDQVDRASTLESVPTKDELQGLFETTDGSPNPNVLVATDRDTNEVLGYGMVRWWQEDSGTFLYIHSGKVHPEHRQQGIGTALLEAMQERIRTVAADHPTDAPKAYGANASSTEAATTALLEKSGYEKMWSLVEMEYTSLAELEKLPPPEGYELRDVATDEDKRAVYTANKKLYEGEFGSSPVSDEDYQDFLADNPDPSLWKVLWKNDELAGFVLSKTGDERAEIMEVSVLPQFQRQGLGKYLMLESMVELRNRGVDTIRLHTDATGTRGGRQLYENIGFKSLKEHYRYRKTLE